MKKQVIVSAVTAALLGSVAVGCSGGAGTGTGGQGGAQPSAQGAGSDKPVRIEILRPGNALPKPEDNALKQALDKKLNIDLDISIVGTSDYKNQVNVRLAAGNYPDIFELDPGEIKAFADKGLLLDLTPYVAKMKSLTDFQGEEHFKRGFIAGKQYAIGRDANLPFNTFWIRKDWLDKLGLQPPATLDEFKAVAKAFADNDPDGNGKKDTFGLTGFEFDTFAPLYGAFGVGSPGTLYMKNGKLTDAVFDPAMKDALGYIKGLIDAGGVDLEFITNKNGLGMEKAYQGKAGIVYAGWQSIVRKDSEEKWKSVNKDAQWVQLASPRGPGGQYDASYDFGKAAQYFVISKAVEKDPAKLQKIIDYFNYLASPEGMTLVSYGIEGRHYKLTGGKVEPTELMDKEGGYFSVYQMAGRKELEYLSTRFPYAEKVLQFTNTQPRIHELNSYVYSYPPGFNKNDVDRFMKDELIKFIFGKRNLNEYDAFLQTMNQTFKHDAYMEQAAAQIKEKGALK